MELYGAHMLKNEIKHPLALMAASLMDQGLSAKALDIVDTLLKEPFQLVFNIYYIYILIWDN